MEVPPDVESLVPHRFFSAAKHVFVRSFSGREPFHHVHEHRRHRDSMDHVVALHPHRSVVVSGDVLRTEVRRGSAATARAEAESQNPLGMLTLEAAANPRHLTYFEREKLVSADQFDPKELAAGDAPKEDAPRELLDAMFCQDTWEVWTAEGIDFLARCNDFEEARRITQSFRDEGVPAQLSRTVRTVYPV